MVLLLLLALSLDLDGVVLHPGCVVLSDGGTIAYRKFDGRQFPSVTIIKGGTTAEVADGILHQVGDLIGVSDPKIKTTRFYRGTELIATVPQFFPRIMRVDQGRIYIFLYPVMDPDAGGTSVYLYPPGERLEVLEEVTLDLKRGGFDKVGSRFFLAPEPLAATWYNFKDFWIFDEAFLIQVDTQIYNKKGEVIGSLDLPDFVPVSVERMEARMLEKFRIYSREEISSLTSDIAMSYSRIMSVVRHGEGLAVCWIDSGFPAPEFMRVALFDKNWNRTGPPFKVAGMLIGSRGGQGVFVRMPDKNHKSAIFYMSLE